MAFPLRVACLVLCMGSSFTAALAGDSSNIRRAASLVQTGDRAFKSGNAAKAEKSFRKALDVIPGYPEAHLGLGHLAMTQGRFEDALAEYTAAERGYREISDLLYQLSVQRYADAQREIRELEDEVRVINSANVKVSESTRASKSLELKEKIRELRAMEYPDEAAALEPPPAFHFHRGNALFRLGRATEALESWETCVAEDPQFPLVYNNLAIIYLQQGRIDEALQSLSKAEELGVTVNPKLKADLLARASAGAGADQRP